jgi:hypothetical protein
MSRKEKIEMKLKSDVQSKPYANAKIEPRTVLAEFLIEVERAIDGLGLRDFVKDRDPISHRDDH